MTGYTVHTGSTERFADGWDQIFKKKKGKGSKSAASKPSAKKSKSKKKRKQAGKSK